MYYFQKMKAEDAVMFPHNISKALVSFMLQNYYIFFNYKNFFRKKR